MDRRVTFGLAGLAAVMFAFIVFFESGSLTTGEVEGRRGHVVERFVRARVTGLVLDHGDVHLRMVRHQEEDETLDTFDVGSWTMEEPISSPADPDSVDSLLSAVEWLDARRELSDITAEDRTRFGFDSPRATLAVTVADEQFTIVVGGADPRGDGVYVGIDDDLTRAYVVGTDFPEALEHDVDHFRRKDLYPDFRTRDAENATLVNASGTIEVVRDEGRWAMAAPTAMLGRGAAIDELLRTLTDLRATRFLADDLDGAEEAWGLGTPSREITVALSPWATGSEHAGETREDIHVRVGAACPEHDDEVVVAAGEGPIVCVEAAAIENFDATAERLREARVVSTPDDDVERVRIEVGDASFELRRDDSEWVLVDGESETLADASAVEEWLGALRHETFTSLEPATDASIADRGLDAPRATLTLTRTDDGGTEVVTLGREDDGVWARRGDEAQLVHFAIAVTELLTPTPLRFRARRLVDRSRESIDRVVIVRGSVEERAEKDGSSWRVTAPIESNADGATLGDLTDALAPLEALRFVATSASREHGLDAPRFVLRVHFSGEEAEEEDDEDGHDHGEEDDEEDEDEDEPLGAEPLDLTLRIGAATEGGAFAQVEGEQTVFVVPQTLVDAALHPLVSHDVLAIAASDVAQLTIVHGADRHQLVSTGGAWVIDGAAAPTDATQALLDQLADLRALGTTSYGGSIARPVATVEVVRHSADSVVDRFTIGPREGTDDDAWHEVRREGIDVGFRVRAATVDVFLGYPPAAP